MHLETYPGEGAKINKIILVLRIFLIYKNRNSQTIGLLSNKQSGYQIKIAKTVLLLNFVLVFLEPWLLFFFCLRHCLNRFCI